MDFRPQPAGTNRDHTGESGADLGEEVDDVAVVGDGGRCQTTMVSSFERNWTEPSHRSMFMPPMCPLPKLVMRQSSPQAGI